MAGISVMVVDDHAIVRMGLRSLVESQSGMSVAGDAANGEAAVEAAARLKPDVVLLDLVMPGMGGEETTKEILKVSPDSKILILTTFGTADEIAHALKAGAKGAMLKNCAPSELAAAIRSIAFGGTAVSQEILQTLDDDPPVAALSPRQATIIAAVAKGLSNAVIADQLGISQDMVKDHLSALFKKLGAANRSEAVAIAMRKRLLVQG